MRWLIEGLRSLTQPDLESATWSAPEGGVGASSEASRKLADVLGELPPEERKAIDLVFHDECSLQQAGTRCGRRSADEMRALSSSAQGELTGMVERGLDQDPG